MGKSSILIDIDDPRSDKIADAISNKTSKKILGLLADGEMSGSEISSKLDLSLNTVGYNLKKLTEAGLTEKSKKVFWSAKGKKMDLYRVSNKRIVISPRRIVRGVLPAALVTGVLAIGVKLFVGVQNVSQNAAVLAKDSFVAVEDAAVGSAVRVGELAVEPSVGSGIYSTLASAPNSWAWFLIGGLTALLVLFLWNMKRSERRQKKDE